MEPQFYVNGTDLFPEGEIADNSLFTNTKNETFRYLNGEWVKLEAKDETSSK
jgi:hypothetical protein